MGLDMYLNKKTYIGANYEHNNVKGLIELTKGSDNKPIKVKMERLVYLEEQVGYWRKANQIHKWFVDNVQDGKDDCGDYNVSEDKLEELLSICKKIKESVTLKNGLIKTSDHLENGVWMPQFEEGKEIADYTIAAELLPTKSGFFFGSTDYDEYYMDDIDNTIAIIEPLLLEKEEGKDYLNGDIYYTSSW